MTTLPRNRRPSLPLLALLAGWPLFDVQQANARPGAIRFAGRDAELTITGVSDRTVRLTLAPVDGAPGLDASPVLVPRTWPAPALRLTELRAEQNLMVGDQRVSIMPDPLTVEIRSKEGKL